MSPKLFVSALFCSLLLISAQDIFSPAYAQSLRKGVIFTAEETQRMLTDAKNPDITAPLWTPSVEQVLALEKDLVPFFNNNMQYRSKVRRDPELYKRQYFGITRNGTKVILANFFCEQYWTTTDDWRRRVVISADFRGDCFFMIRYDPKTREIFDLVFR